jgi:mono/diheme cytochrome c family protein
MPRAGITRACALLLLAWTLTSAAAPAPQFPETVNQFFSTHCVSCHGPDKQKGKFRIDTLSQDLLKGPHGDDWHEILDALILEEMPPEDEKQPDEAARVAMIEFLTATIEDAAAQRRSSGGKVVMRRLTNYEYDNTLNDLLALDEHFSKDFPPDSHSEDGFKNNGQYMGMSALQMENYLEAAKRALDEAIYTGEQPALKTVDIKDVRVFTNASGEEYPIKQRSGHARSAMRRSTHSAWPLSTMMPSAASEAR